MKKTSTKRLVIASVFWAVAVVGSLISEVLIYSLKKSNILHMMQETMGR